MTAKEKRARQATYMRQYMRTAAGRAYLARTKERRAARAKADREARYEEYRAREIAYQSSKRGKLKSRERQRRWIKENPEKRMIIVARYQATDGGRLYRWSNSAAQRCNKAWHYRSDGRFKLRAGGNVTPKQLRELWQRQAGRCAVTGRDLVVLQGMQHLNSPSVDRIDREKGYTLDNIRLVTYQTNCARLFGTDEQLRSFCRDVLRHIEN